MSYDSCRKVWIKDIMDIEYIGLTETQKKMFTENGDVKRYIDSDVVFPFGEGQIADISFPNGYGKWGSRVTDLSPALACATMGCYVVKVRL